MSYPKALQAAATILVERGKPALVDHARWANTYNVTPQDVEMAISVAMTLRARENEGDGK
jgi:hypothetical protein